MFLPLLQTLQKINLVDQRSNGSSGSVSAIALIRTLNSKEFLAVSPKVGFAFAKHQSYVVSQPTKYKHQYQTDWDSYHLICLSKNAHRWWYTARTQRIPTCLPRKQKRRARNELRQGPKSAQSKFDCSHFSLLSSWLTERSVLRRLLCGLKDPYRFWSVNNHNTLHYNSKSSIWKNNNKGDSRVWFWMSRRNLSLQIPEK